MDIVTSLLQRIHAKKNWTVVSEIHPTIYITTHYQHLYKNLWDECITFLSQSHIRLSDIVQITQIHPHDYHSLQYKAFQIIIRVKTRITAVNLLNDALTCEFKLSYMERCFGGYLVIVKSSSEDFEIDLYKDEMTITDKKELENYVEIMNNKMTEDMNKIKRLDEHLSLNLHESKM